MNRIRFQHRNRRHGGISVEVAIILPVLLMVLFGCYEISRANLMRHAAQAAAYEGARVGIVPGSSIADVEKGVNFVLRSVGVRDVSIITDPQTIEVDTQRIRVRVEIPLGSNMFVPSVFTKNMVLAGECELSRELVR